MKRYYIKGKFVNREGHEIVIEELIEGYNAPFVIAKAKRMLIAPAFIFDYTFVGECTPAVNTFERDKIDYEELERMEEV